MSSYFYTMSDKLKILCVPANEGGCAYYRIIAPMQKLEELYGDQVEIKWDKNPLGINEEDGSWIQDWDFSSIKWADIVFTQNLSCLLYTSPSPRDRTRSRMPSSA